MQLLYLYPLLLASVHLCHAIKLFHPLKALNQTIGSDSPFKWTDITPKPYLEYHACYDDLQCARLEVPLNWNATESESNETIAIAVVRVPARVPVTDPRYGGAILTNPGGPGQSGVDAARFQGRKLQTLTDAAFIDNSNTYVVNSSSALYFDIIGWDPRGVSHTTPFYTCQQNPGQQINQYLKSVTQLLGTPEAVFANIWSWWSAIHDNCAYDPVKNPQGSKIERYMSTSFVALDMVEIIERHGQWREKQARTPQEKEHLKWHKGEEPLLFAAGSYGTDIGQIFASMQPHRVQRMFLDGVDDPEDGISGSTTQALWDADTIMDHMFAYCALAGPKKCALYAGPSAQDTRERVFAIIADIEQNGPVPVPRHNKIDGSGAVADGDVVTLSDVFAVARGMLYTPLEAVAYFADAMSPLSSRDGRAFVDIFKAGKTDIFGSTTYEKPGVRINAYDPGSNTHEWASLIQTGVTIACAEAWVRRNQTEMRAWWDYLQWQSYWTAPVTATLFMSCSDTFPVNTTWNYLWDHPTGSNVTAHGILFGSNKFDPICPLRSAQLAQTRFRGSSLLINDGDGHMGFSNPSLQYAKVVRQYFQTGTLPPNGLVTLPLERPLLGEAGARVATLGQNASLEDQMLVKAITGFNII